MNLPCSIAVFHLKICQLLKPFRDTHYSLVSGGLLQSGVALKPLLPNDILLFLSQEKQRENCPKNPKPMLFGSWWFTSFLFPNCSLVVLLLHFAVVFESKWKHFFFPWSRSAAWSMGLCGSTSHSAHLSISLYKPVVVRPLICCNLPLQPWCQDRSYFRSHSRLSSIAKQNFKDTWKNRIKKNKIKRWQKRGVKDCSPICALLYCIWP